MDGETEKLTVRMSILVEGNKISKIARSIGTSAGANVIDVGGWMLIPGIIDIHWHTMLNFWPISEMLSYHFGRVQDL